MQKFRPKFLTLCFPQQPSRSARGQGASSLRILLPRNGKYARGRISLSLRLHAGCLEGLLEQGGKAHWPWSEESQARVCLHCHLKTGPAAE